MDGSSIALHCASEPTLTTAAEQQAAANHRVARLALLGPLPGWATDAAGRALVVVRSDTDKLAVSVSTLREWRSDYIIVQNHTIMFTNDGDGHSLAATFTVIGNNDMLRSGNFRHGNSWRVIRPTGLTQIPISSAANLTVRRRRPNPWSIARGVISLALAQGGCTNSSCPTVLRAGGQHELQLVVRHEGNVTPERRALLAPIRDTAWIMVTADSVVSDSVFGRYGGDLSHFPVMFGAATPESHLVRGRLVGVQLSLMLSPYVTDASLELTGDQTSSPGTWVALDHRDSGRFRLREVGRR